MTNELYILKSIQASIEAGNAILDVYHSDFAVEHKNDSSPLTLADKRSHEIIVARLSEFKIPILSEEGKGIPYMERKKWDTLWIVDPLDGTKEFIKKNDEFTVNIALVQDGKPVFGVIFVPVKNILYFAGKDLGAYKLENSQVVKLLSGKSEKVEKNVLLNNIINCSVKLPINQSTVSPFTIVGSRSHATPGLESFVEKKRQEYGDVKFISAGSSLKFCLVAEGMADIYPRFGPTMEWDTAAGQAIAENAGARVICYDTREPLAYNKENLLNPWFMVIRPRAVSKL